jgi:hypothetical protein
VRTAAICGESSASFMALTTFLSCSLDGPAQGQSFFV